MTTRTLHRLMPMLLLPFLAAAEATPVASSTPVHGDYVEVRTASVFAGACHYNGERVTEGRSAVMAWRIDGGQFDRVDLAGVKVLAAVSCDDNLAEQGASRRSTIVVDADSDTRAAAAVDWVKARVGDQLGSVANVRRAPVSFTHESDSYAVRVDGFASLKVKAMPDRACCSQPELVWYQPLMPVADRRVGYTEAASATVREIGATWQRSDENSAIYGSFER